MTIRTSTKTVTFKRPFVLGGFDEVLPAGNYIVETDEELIEGISFPAHRRILTVMHLHPKASDPGLTQTLTIDPNELDAALKRDQATAKIGLEANARQAHRIRKKAFFDAKRVERKASVAMELPAGTHRKERLTAS